MLYTIDSALSKVLNNSEFNLNEIQNKIIELIVNNKNITQNEIASILGKNVRTIKRSFKVLIDNNVIERIGSDKTGYWIVKSEGEYMKDILITVLNNYLLFFPEERERQFNLINYFQK